MNPINIQLEEFMSYYFEPDETVCLRLFDDRKTGSFKGLKLECPAGKISSLVDTLKKHNEQNRGIFFVVNSGGHNDGEITRINAHFTEMDEGSFEEQWAKINAFPLPPSLVVKTRKSLHCYWLVKNGKVGKFRHIQKQLAAQFDGDPACINESRVLRLPGFYHCKGEPVMVELVKFNPELRYTQDQLSQALPAIHEETAVAAPASKGSRKGLTQVVKRCDFIHYCKANAAILPENLWYAMISNLAVFEDGGKVIHALSKPYPKYNYTETQTKITHFLESGTKPMTCAKIAEYGFKCPKLEHGGLGAASACGCKSPAALCYKPLNTNELLNILNDFEIPESALDKIQIIKNFIQDYLYNIDGVTAETIINYNVKERFVLKASDLSPLIKLHREIYKKYSENRDKSDKVSALHNGELPLWYEVTERGGIRHNSGIQADYMAANIAAFLAAGVLHVYENGVYVQKSDITAQAMVRSLMIPKYATMNAINDTANQWKTQIEKPVEALNGNPYIINVKNGLYNVKTGTLHEHTTDYYSTVQINANYAPNATCPQFLEFLKNILPESELPLIQEIFGYLLIPVNKAQKSFVFVGAPNAGKSTLLSVAQDILLGSANVSNIPWQNIGDRFNKAELFGKLANIFADLPSKAIEDAGIFKSLTGEDSIIGERKNRDPFSFRSYARFLFSCNDIPRNYGDRSGGFYRRLIIVRFDKSIPANERDPNLRDKLIAEADGILAWSIVGLKRLMENNFQFGETERTAGELQRYKVECSSALSFLDEYCVNFEDGRIQRNELYQKYKDFCMENGHKASSQIAFNKEVESAYPGVKRDVDRVANRRVWLGIKFMEGGKGE